MLTMQDALLRLTEYWAAQGCLIVQPSNTEVGAGTLNPATALRVLGPEPWRAAYVEPSVRPDDSRYGQNPNRLQTHTQFQVVLKPEPGDPQELYLASLAALGIDTAAHDVRFVEDNWASPALGAWGLGWEVWLDGLEITQFTYFQQSGGIALDPVAVEITYGVERIVMALQGVRHFKDIAYAPGISYGEAFGQAEYEMSRYYLDDADIDATGRLFDTYAAEAERLIRERLPVPAHGFVLKCSHAFNILDARGAVSTTERARAFARIRGLAHDVARLWAERREELGHPLSVAGPHGQGPQDAGAKDSATAGAATTGTADPWPETDAPAVFVLEIGVEELPPSEVGRSRDALRESVEAGLAAARLAHGRVESSATPRRIIVTVADVHPREPDHDHVDRGPRWSAAFDAEGLPTAAARGFAAAKGAQVGELGRTTIQGIEYAALNRMVRGRPAAQVLAGVAAQSVGRLRSERNMRWSAPGLTFSRPIRWIVALLGPHVVPFSVGGLESGRVTRLHRTSQPPVERVSEAGDLAALLERHGILVDAAARRAAVLAQAEPLAQAVGARVDPEAESAVLDEVANLVEHPNPLLGSFDPGYLALPPEILTTVMRKHQRYLPLRDASGELLAHFVAVANGDCDHDAVRAGNEAVLRARFEDARFFWDADLKTPLEQMRRRLEKLSFEPRLGSVADRAERIRAVAAGLADRVGLDDGPGATLEAAAALAKFDLGSQLVIELSSLAGTMAEQYALRAGQPPQVARALAEMELPRTAAGALPASVPGALLALADRFDLLAGLFAVGSEPTGSSDPFGMRRAAAGVVNILRDRPELSAVTVTAGLAAAAARLPVPADGETLDRAAQFVTRRFEQQLLEAGHPVEEVRAVLPLADAPAAAAGTLRHLRALRAQPAFGDLVAMVQRVRRIVPAATAPGCDPDLFEQPAEHDLLAALEAVRAELVAGADDLTRFTAKAAALTGPMSRYFDQVLVMAQDERTRNNRLGLLAAVSALFDGRLAWEELF